MKEPEAVERLSGMRTLGSASPATVDASAIDWDRDLPNARAIAVGRILAALGSVVGLRLLTEYLPPDTFGRYKLALAGIALVTGILVRPFSQYAMCAWHDALASRSQRRFVDHYGRSFRYFVCTVGLVMAAGAFVVTEGRWFAPVDLVAAATVLVLRAMVDYERSILITRARMRDVALIDTVTQWLIPITIVLAVTIGESLSQILAVHACVLAGVVVVPRLHRRASTDRPLPGGGVASSVSAAWKFAYPLMISGCLNWILHESDRFIVGFFHDSHAVALYAAAYGLASAPFLVAGGAVIQFITPLVLGSSARGGKALVPRSALSVMLLICAAGVFLFWLLGDRIAYLVLAEGYRATASQLLVWIAIGYACLSIATCFDLAAYGTRRTQYVALATGAAAATNVGLDLLLVPEHSALGAAWATSAALAVYLLCIVLLVGRQSQVGGSHQAGPITAAGKSTNRSARGRQS